MTKSSKWMKASVVATTVLAGTVGAGLPQITQVESKAFAAQGSSSVFVSGTTTSQTELKQTVVKQPNVTDAKISKEEAEKRTRALFPLLNNAKLTSIDYGEPNVYPSTQKAIWTLSWSIQNGSSTSGFSTRVDALNGDILSYMYPFSLDKEQPYIPASITSDEAEKIAKDFITMASPSLKVSDLKLGAQDYFTTNRTLFGPVKYSFNYEVSVNGIPADTEGLRLTVNGKGEITEYSRNTSQVAFPSPETVLTQAEAEKKIKSGLKLSLAYIPDNIIGQTPNKQNIWRLGYVPSSDSVNLIDAKTGKAIDVNQTTSEPVGNVSYKTFEPSARLFVKHTGKELTSEEAVNVVKQLVTIPANYAENTSRSSYWVDPQKEAWSLSWNNPTQYPGSGQGINAVVDAATGQLLEYNPLYMGSHRTESVNTKLDKSTITEAEARVKVVELFQRIYPEAAKLYRIADSPAKVAAADGPAYHFTFQHFYKDIPIWRYCRYWSGWFWTTV